MYAHTAYSEPVRFEWDEAKRRRNLAKHGIDFADAVAALLDEAALTIEDGDAKDEVRWVTLGCDGAQRLLLVVWAEREVDVIRIVSARTASPGEARHYPR